MFEITSSLSVNKYMSSCLSLIFQYLCSHDLDNILLENLGETRTLQAVYELEALVLTGHFSETFGSSATLT